MTGHFLPGNKMAKGNQAQKHRGEMINAMLNAVTPEDLAGITRAMAKAALGGDVQAARLVLEYIVGKPKERVEISGELSLAAVVRRRLQGQLFPHLPKQQIDESHLLGT